MATPIILQEGYDLAMKRDFARERLPKGAVWNSLDWLPSDLGARLRKRGGYAHASQNIASVQATASYIAAGVMGEYAAGQSILIFDEDGRAYEVESAAATEDIGAALTTRSAVFYNDKVIAFHDGGTTAPKKITRSGGTHTIANLGGSPPAAKFGLVYKDVVWALATDANRDRILFSDAGNPEVWDVTNKFLDVSFDITGGATLSNAVLIFMRGRTARIRGSIPPPDTDFIVDDPQFEVGCTDNRSIALYRDKVIWANAQGLYISDGTALEDLTRLCGMKSWWRDVMLGREGFSTGTVYSITGFSIAGGVYGDYYFYSIMNGATLVDSGYIDLTKFTWRRVANLDSVFFFSRLYPEELFFGRRGGAFLGSLSGIFAPASGNKNDGDGDAVLPILELPYFQGEPGIKTLRRLFVGWDIRDASADNPLLTVSYATLPEATTYTAITPTLTETTQYTRQALPLNLAAPGLSLKIAQTNASADTRLYDIELEAIPRERSR